MKILKQKTKIFAIFCTMHCSVSYAGHELAIDMESEDLKKISRILRGANSNIETNKNNHFNIVDIKTQNKLRVKKDIDNQRIIIAYPDVNSLNPFYKFLDSESEMVNAEESYGLKGKIYKKAAELEKSLNFLLQNKLLELAEQCQNYEYIFTGSGLGGAAAVLAASRLLVSQSNSENKVKIINFSSTKVGNTTFVENVHQKVFLKNILHFQKHLDIDPRASTQYVGLPLEITPSEALYDNLFSKKSLIVGATIVGTWLSNSFCSYYNITNNIFSIIPPLLGAAAYHFCSSNIPSDTLITRVSNYVKMRKVLYDEDEQEKIGKIGWFGTRS